MSAGTAAVAGTVLSAGLRDQVASAAAELDTGTGGGPSTRLHLEALGQAGLLDLGAPANGDGALPRMARCLRELSGQCLSTGFSVWAQRMVIEYLTLAPTEWSRWQLRALRAGTRPGVTGMASAFRALSGCGEVDLVAVEHGTGYRVSGTLRWASNVHHDATLVTAARTRSGERFLIGLPIHTRGVQAAPPHDLLGMNSTASTAITVVEAEVTADQVLAADYAPVLRAARPTFLVLQTNLAIGLAETAIGQAEQGLHGVNEVFADPVDDVRRRLSRLTGQAEDLAARVGGDRAPTPVELLTARLEAAQLAQEATGLEIRTAGGAGYASRTPASRRFREATFLPVQSPSEAQLTWELARHRRSDA